MKRRLVIAGVIGLTMLVLCCGGGLGLTFLAVRGLHSDLQAQLQHNPDVIEHIGEIRSFAAEVEETGGRNDGAIVYAISGSKGDAKAIIVSEKNDQGNHQIIWGQLQLPSGETIELDQ